MSGREALERITRRYRLRRVAAALLCAAGTASVAAAAGALLPGDRAVVLLTAGIIAIVLMVAVRAISRVPAARDIARHLDRIDPALEESAELLLADAAGLGVADRIERSRAERAIEAQPPRLASVPDAAARRMAVAGVVGIVAAVALSLIPGGNPRGTAGGSPASTGIPAVGMPRVRSVSIMIRPPRYTGLSARPQESWDLDVAEGSRIEWTVEFDRAVSDARIVLGTDDTIALAPAGGVAARGGTFARGSTLYRLAHGGAESEYHRLLVRQDAAPSVTVLRPAPRTTLASGAARRVPVDVLVQDDHGVRGAALIATVTTGEGEGVRFREQRIPLGAGTRASGGIAFRRVLDLDSLGMAPGDELYFHAVARDGREPAPNEGRSETVFIALADTGAAPPARFAGLAVAVLPEYFRSQRQIIIDTERLIADSARLPVEIFRERANAIGMDQGLLRLRYGAFTGEEFESGVEPDEAHQHDSEENATLLAPGTKATLKGAIAQMWEAELRLRTHRPSAALPYELRALELLKSVQSQSRAYVQRVGFAPPPLEPARKRLTGKLDAIPSRAVSDSVEPAIRQPALIAALSRVRAIAGGARPTASDAAALDEAAEEIARREIPAGAAEAEAQIDALRAVRTLAAALRSGRRCPGCAGAAARALADRSEPAPRSAAPRPPVDGLGRRYLELIGTP